MISLDKFKMFDKKRKRNVFIFLKMLTKCINFAAENEHSVKKGLIWMATNEGPFSKRDNQ